MHHNGTLIILGGESIYTGLSIVVQTINYSFVFTRHMFDESTASYMQTQASVLSQSTPIMLTFKLLNWV